MLRTPSVELGGRERKREGESEKEGESEGAREGGRERGSEGGREPDGRATIYQAAEAVVSDFDLGPTRALALCTEGRLGMASSSWMASATNVTASLISAAAHELLIDPLSELSSAMEDALDMVVGAEPQQSARTAAKASSGVEERSTLRDVSNAVIGQTGAAVAAPQTPLCKLPSRGGRTAPERMTFAELMALIETELNLDPKLKPKEVLLIASELLGLEPLPGSAGGTSVKDDAIRVAKMLLPTSSVDVASPVTPVVRRQSTVVDVNEPADVPSTPSCTPQAVTEARERRRTAFLLQEVSGRDRLNSAEKFLAGRSCRPVAEFTQDEEDQQSPCSDGSNTVEEFTNSAEQVEIATGIGVLLQPEPEPELQEHPELNMMEELLLLGISTSKTIRDSSTSSAYPLISADADVFWNGNMSTALRGAILAELVLRGNIIIKQQGVVPQPTISVQSSSLTGDMVLDQTVHIIQSDQSGTPLHVLHSNDGLYLTQRRFQMLIFFRCGERSRLLGATAFGRHMVPQEDAGAIVEAGVLERQEESEIICANRLLD